MSLHSGTSKFELVFDVEEEWQERGMLMIKIPEAQPGLKRKRFVPRPRGFQTALIIIPPFQLTIWTLGSFNGEVIETTPELVLSLELSPVVWHGQVLRDITEQTTLAQVLLRTTKTNRQGVRAWEEEQLRFTISSLNTWTHLHGPALKPFFKRFSPFREIFTSYNS